MRLNNLTAIAAALCCALASGCASITGSEMQTVQVSTLTQSGEEVDKADCALSNAKGTWHVTTPSLATVHRGSEDMQVQCNKKNLAQGSARLISRANGGMYGNIIFGGVVGAVIDNAKGNGYSYPDNVRVVMGESIVLDRNSSAPKVVAVAAAPPAAGSESATPKAPSAGAGAVAMAAPSPAVAGLVAPGTTWRYAYTDLIYDSNSANVAVTVLRADDQVVEERVSANPGSTQARVMQRDIDASAARFDTTRIGANANLVEFAPYLLAKGGEGAIRNVTAVDGYPTAATTAWDTQVNASLWEQVTVPAGSFRALHLEITGEATVEQTGMFRPQRYVMDVWYAPDVKRYVKLEHKVWRAGNVIDHDEIDLVSFSPRS